MKQGLSLLFLLLTSIPMLLAQAPQAFNYQGVARTTGAPIPQRDIGLRIALLQDAINGLIVYQEVHQTTTSQQGLFSLQIGTGNVTTGDFEAIQWGDGPYFIQIELDENGGNNYELIGTSQLLSVPYALYAENSGKPWQEVPNGINYSEGFVGIGEDMPQAPFEVNFEDLSVLKFRNNQVINNNGTQLLVGHTQEGFAGVYLDARNGDFIGEDYSFIKRINNQSLQINNLDAVPIDFLTNDRLRMRIDAIGNVGIGTTSPSTKLQVSDGDIYIKSLNRGVIMQSSNGACWRYRPDNNGNLVPEQIICPN